MIGEILIVCGTVYVLLSPLTWSLSALVREHVRRLEYENDEREYAVINDND